MVVRIVNNKVKEIIPPEATPVESWYPIWFAEQCINAPDFVQQGWYYDSTTGEFSEEPFEPVEPDLTLEDLKAENKLLKAQLQAQVDRSDFIEDCIAEMAMIVYGDV